MTEVVFKRLGLSKGDIEAQASQGNQIRERLARTLMAMHEMGGLSEAELTTLENGLGKLPPDYKDFLRNHNGGVPSLPILKTSNNERVINAFLAAKAPSGFYGSIDNMLKVYQKRIPTRFIPIASAGSGDLLLLSLNSSSFGEVLYWDHNFESDQEDARQYFDNTESVAVSFSDLLGRLLPDV